MYLKNSLILVIGCTLATGACKKDVEASDSSSSSSGSQYVNADADNTNNIQASDDSSISGSSISIPPGSLTVSTEVTLLEGDTLSTDHVSAALDLGSDIFESAGQAVVFLSDPETNAVEPMSIGIEMGNSAALAASDDIVVIYKKIDADTGEFLLGVLPESDVTVSGNTVKLKTKHFGVYQVANSSTNITESTEIVTTVPVGIKSSPLRVGFKSASQSVDESTGSATVELEVTKSSHSVITVPFSITGTADEDDHGLIDGVFQIPAGDTTSSLSFKLTDDGTSEGDETVIITLGQAHHAALTDETVHTLTITD
jgi:hypothetical protein